MLENDLFGACADCHCSGGQNLLPAFEPLGFSGDDHRKFGQSKSAISVWPLWRDNGSGGVAAKIRGTHVPWTRIVSVRFSVYSWREAIRRTYQTIPFPRWRDRR